jgi:hypothetical protein
MPLASGDLKFRAQFNYFLALLHVQRQKGNKRNLERKTHKKAFEKAGHILQM